MGPSAVSLLILLPWILNLRSAADADPSFRYNCVSNENFIANSIYGANDHLLLTQLSSKDFKNGFSNIFIGQSPDQVNAIGLCGGDQKEDACRICLNQIISELQQRCSDHKEAIAWSDYCMVHYSSHEIFGVVQTYPFNVLYSGNASDFDGFSHVLSSLLNSLTGRAATGGPFRKFAAGNTKRTDSFPRIYALEQLTPDLSQQDCSFCRETAIARIETSSYRRTGCRVFQPSCSVRYETSPFFAAVDVVRLVPQQILLPPVEGNDNNTSLTIIYFVGASLAGILLLSVICYFVWILLRHWRPGRVVSLSETENGVKQYRYREIWVAANGFCDENLLGAGGYGAVYKGKLSTGLEIAVKRLKNLSRQNDLEFEKEASLGAQLRHRNVVRSYGFCSEGDERLLILEFVPSGSLDHFLSDPSKREQLDWEMRSQIIKGVASGLLYLHKYSHVQIVHRDIKASNILLDQYMNPKIADFGIAKLLKGDESQLNTNMPVGTYGYVAPEYALNGHISVKIDVYSFGILMLEIVSGQKASNSNSNGMSMLLSSAWENWRNKTISELIDPILREGPRDEIIRCIHIGLLCVQDNEFRPKMDSVVNYLDCSTIPLQKPKPPTLFVNQEGHPNHGRMKRMAIKMIRPLKKLIYIYSLIRAEPN